jgi:hypothetical protein
LAKIKSVGNEEGELLVWGGEYLGGDGEEGVNDLVVIVFVFHEVLGYASLGQEVHPHGLAELLEHQVLFHTQWPGAGKERNRRRGKERKAA